MSSSSENVFNLGKYVPKLILVEPKGRGTPSATVPPTKPLLIATPSIEGNFPVLLLLHGYMYSNSFYSQLILHIASHGYIVIAPQLYVIAGPDVTGDIESAASITDWISEGLISVLPPGVQPDLSKVALSGHSRGGKAAFALALGYAKTTTSLKYSVLLGIDPVDGRGERKQTNPPVLTYEPCSFNLNMPVLVIGSGLGEEMATFLHPTACAPRGVNHKNFYDECKSPAYYFVVKDYGHTDFLDDDTGFGGFFTTQCVCKNGKSRAPMRTFTGGTLVAFMNAYLQGNRTVLDAIKDGLEVLPVELQANESKTTKCSSASLQKV